MAKIRYSLANSPSTWFLISLLLCVLLFYTQQTFSPKFSLEPNVLATRKSPTQPTATFASLRKRASDYPSAVALGNEMLCVFPLNVAEAQIANGGNSLEAAAYLQTDTLSTAEGWTHSTKSGDFSSSAGIFLAQLGVDSSAVEERVWTQTTGGFIVPDPNDEPPNFGEAATGILTSASFENAFIPSVGVIIADNNLSVPSRMAALGAPADWRTSLVVTHFQQFSDVVWLQWVASNGGTGDLTNVNYIIRNFIINDETLEIVCEAIYNAYGATTVGNSWYGRITLTAEKNPDEFAAVLGSPNGSGVGYFLLTHKQALGIKETTQVDIYMSDGEIDITSDFETSAISAGANGLELVFTIVEY
ncbi:uncharacterized protein PAC_02785 [Phialocephala subalpina]|uniref:Uncharacterized protein n=1 Tax=Phialocephala subalpina TaxID=576137 RepID=A0A1L7WJJ2_9HELO|nr:uncharacterized protein PAC_02785 [Phialocephala subalpina]